MNNLTKILLLFISIVIAAPAWATDINDRIASIIESGRPKVVVSNNGDLKFYKYDDVQKAINEASPNDTVFLPEGVFPSITVDKGIVLLGSGQSTVINGDLLLAPPDTLLNAVIDGMKINGKLYNNKPVRGLWVRMCSIEYLFENDISLIDVLIERCNIYKLYAQDRIKNAHFINCEIARLQNHASSYSFNNYINCYIHGYTYSSGTSIRYYGTYVNCIVNLSSDSQRFFTNCLYNQSSSPSGSDAVVNSWNISGDDWNSNNLNNPEWLEEHGYIGTDGTVIGPYGGSFPYTLEPSLPTVKEHKVRVDHDTQQLIIDLKLSGVPEGTPETPTE